MAPDRLGAAIATVCADPGLLAAMDGAIERFGRPDSLPFRWDAGGCLILAEAIRRVAGGVLVGACEEGDDGEPDRASIDHVMVEFDDGTYADALGVRDLDRALDDVVEIGGFVSPVFVPLRGVDDPCLTDIATDEPLTRAVAARLAAELH